MKRSVLTIAGILALGVALLTAQEAPPPQPPPTQPAQAQPEAPRALPAGNVKVTFSLAPADDGDQGLFVVSCGAYSSRRSFENDDNAHWMEVSGDLELQKDGRLLLHMTVNLHNEGDEETAEFSTTSTLLLVPGKEVEVAKFGDKNLVVNFKPL